jgi:hypothetical protein
MATMTMENLREAHIRGMQDLLMDLSVDLYGFNYELGTMSHEPTERRARLEERVRETRCYINQTAKELVDQNPEFRCGPEATLKIIPTIEEPLAMYFVDSNALKVLVLAPTAQIAATAVEKIVDRAREGNWEPTVCRRCLKKFADGKPIKIRGVYYVCDLKEAIRDG